MSPRSARPPEKSEPPPVDLDALAANEDLRYGIDLFNHGFPWEAHEAWEPLWLAMPRDRPERSLMQGLIHAAAAAIKARTGAPAVAREFVTSACEYLALAPADIIDVRAFERALHAWDLTGAPPTITLV